MPKGKGKKRYKKKSKIKDVRRLFKNNANTLVSWAPKLFPDSCLVRLTYSVTDAVDPTGTATAVRNYGANCLFDPYLGVGGAQPRGLDEMFLLYNHYTVLQSKIKVVFQPNATNGLPATVAVAIQPGTASSANILDYYENSDCTTKQLAQGAEYQQTIIKSWDARKIFGKPYKSIIGSSNYKGSETANPTEQSVFQVVVGTANQQTSQDPTTVWETIFITYTAMFTEKKTPDPS